MNKTIEVIREKEIYGYTIKFINYFDEETYGVQVWDSKTNKLQSEINTTNPYEAHDTYIYAILDVEEHYEELEQESLSPRTKTKLRFQEGYTTIELMCFPTNNWFVKHLDFEPQKLQTLDAYHTYEEALEAYKALVKSYWNGGK